MKSTRILGRRLLRAMMIAAWTALLTDAAMASFLPGPFAFSFFTQGLTELFLLPFQVAGCI